MTNRMNVFELTRAMIEIDSVTPNEESMGLFLVDHLSQLAARTGGVVERMPVEPKRFNVFAHWGEPVVTLSTHMDTVPPFFPSREDNEFIWGRGACDTKGIIAAMIFAVRELLEAGLGVGEAGVTLGGSGEQAGVEAGFGDVQTEIVHVVST